MKFVAGTCSDRLGLVTTTCLVQVVRGTTYVPVDNVGTTDMLLYHHIGLGFLSRVQVVSLPKGIQEVRSITVMVYAHVVSSSVLERLEEVDLSALSEEEQKEIRGLLGMYSSVFSTHDTD